MWEFRGFQVEVVQKSTGTLQRHVRSPARSLRHLLGLRNCFVHLDQLLHLLLNLESRNMVQKTSLQTLSLDLQPLEGDGDLSQFLSEMKLPQPITLSESFVVPGSNTTLNKDDVLLLHFIYDNPIVHATTTNGTELRLPIHAEQKYEILPLGEYIFVLLIRHYYQGMKENFSSDEKNNIICELIPFFFKFQSRGMAE